MSTNHLSQSLHTKGIQHCFGVASRWTFVSHSDKTLTILTKHIHHELLPTLDEEDGGLVSAVASALPLTSVEEAIKAVLVRNNYGVEAPTGVKLPTALCVWRWEVRAQYMDWLPKNCREKAEARLAERIQVCYLIIFLISRPINRHRQGRTLKDY